MITDQFLNICSLCALTDLKLQADVMNSLKSVLKFYETNFADDIPVDVKPKFFLAKNLLELRSQGMGKQEIVDSILTSGKYDSFKSFLKLTSDKEIKQEELDGYVAHIKIKKKFTNIVKEFDKLQTFVDDFSSNSFDNLNVAIEKYDNLISSLYVDLAQEKRNDSVGKVSSLDFASDDFESVLDQLQLNNSGVNTVPTGYVELDKYMKGGYQPSRLYVFGGASGDGKSTYMINNIFNAVEKDTPDPDGKTNIYLYATLENLLDESTHRLYCAWSDQDPDKVISNLSEERGKIKSFMKDKLRKHNANIIMDYFAPDSLTVFGLRNWIQHIKDKYKNTGRVRGVWVDYLDLVKSGKEYDVYRLELGQVTLLMKAVAVLENIPLITVTQLNRDGYDKESFSLTQMGESIKKVEHSDFVALLKNQDEEERIGDFCKLDVFIGKNRCGPKNKKLQLLSKFSHFLIKDSAKGAGLSFDVGVKLSSSTPKEDEVDLLGGFL